MANSLNQNLFEDLPSRSVAKGTILQFAGDTGHYAFRTVSGCLKGYIVDRAAKEHIIQFAPEGWIISDMDSLLREVPARLYISALEDSEIQYVPRERLLKLEQYDKEALVRLSQILMNNIVATNKRLMGMLTSTAEERYQEFLHQYPGLSNRIPQKLIAAYIGITPEYLSEVRRKIMRGKSGEKS